MTKLIDYDGTAVELDEMVFSTLCWRHKAAMIVLVTDTLRQMWFERGGDPGSCCETVVKEHGPPKYRIVSSSCAEDEWPTELQAWLAACKV